MNFNNTRFKVQIGETELNCSRVSNLVFSVEFTTTRTGTDKALAVQHHMGGKAFTPIIIERPLKSSDNAFFNFWDQGNPLDEEGKRNIVAATIQLLNDKSEVVTTWTLINPQFTQLSYSDLDAKGREIVTEQLEIIHEGINVEMH